MKRSLITLTVLAALSMASVVAFLRAHEIWDDHRSLPQAVSDLWFIVDVALTEKRGLPAPPLTQREYRATFERLSYHVDRGVNEFARERMVAWGEEVAPLLMDELDREDADAWKYHPQVAAALGEIGHAPAAMRLVEKLYDESVRDVGRDKILDAIGQLADRETIPALLAWHDFDRQWREERYAGRERIPGPPTRLYTNLGRLGARDFLIEQLPLVDGRGYTISILRGLGYTRDPAALPILNAYLDHADSGIQQYASRAIDLIEISGSIDSALASFPSGNIFEQQHLIESYFSSRHAADDARVIPLLEDLLMRGPLRGDAAVALARIDTPSSIHTLQPALAWDAPQKLVAVLARDARDHGFLLLERFLDHPDPRVQHATLTALLPVPSRRVDAWLERKAAQGAPPIAQEAGRVRFLRDKYELYYAMVELLQRAGEANGAGNGEGNADRIAAQERLYDWISKSVRLPFSLAQPFAALHYLALVFALIFGFFLVLNLARAFELYRFHTTLHFLIAACILGSFLVVDYDERFYRYSIGVSLFLLLGYLFMERGANEPGRAGSRFGRMAGASLWLVVPSLLYFATPLLADSLHRAFSQGLFFSAFCGYSLLCLVLLLEEYLLPRHVIPRSTRSTRWMATLLSTALLGFIALAVFGHATRLARSDADSAHLALWMLAPIAALILWQWHQLLSASSRPARPLPPMPDTRLKVQRDREMVTLHLRDPLGPWRRVARAYRRLAAMYAALSPGKKWWRIALGSLQALAAAIAAAGGLAIPLGLLALPLYGLMFTDWSQAPLWQFAVLHLLSTALVFCLLLTLRSGSRLVLQMRNGYVRSGHPTLGAVFVGGYWRRRPPCEVDLSHAAREWLVQVLRAA